MAGDLEFTEWAVFSGDGPDEGAASEPGDTGIDGAGDSDAPRVIHRYGRLGIVAAPPGSAAARAALSLDVPALDIPVQLDEIEQFGLAALLLRSSADYVEAKRHRPRAGEPWDMPDCTSVAPTPQAGAPEAGADPTSAFLEGSVAVGIVIVEGPTANLQFSSAEQTKVVAEVQNGLGFYPGANPEAGISFSYDIRTVRLTVPANPSAPDLEAHWRNPTMAALGFSADFTGVVRYVEDIRSRLGTRWTYCGFFTKYPLIHFAYASIGGPRVVMDFANDGWGPDNIDRVFAHETGHIFGCPDEYASSGCDCGGSWGRFGQPNGNCQNCAAGGGVSCLMRQNDFVLCPFTPRHLGWRSQFGVDPVLGADNGFSATAGEPGPEMDPA